MKKIQLFTIIGIAVYFVIVILPTLLDSVFTFLLAGFIPGTSLSISPSIIFVSTTLITGFVVAHLIINASSRYIQQSSSHARKAILPGRRFHRL